MAGGKYVVIEGHDGTGKSTQVALLRKALADNGIESIEFHEPEGTPITNEIRTILKNGDLPRDSVTNLLLFTAARHEIWQTALRALAEGTWVIASRNYYSSLAYQGYGEGLDPALIKSLTRQFTDERYMSPDLAVILTLDDEAEREKRMQQRGALEVSDTFESKDAVFQRSVREGYEIIAREYGLPTIAATASPGEIAEHIYELTKAL